jgi:hypothetical protein
VAAGATSAAREVLRVIESVDHEELRNRQPAATADIQTMASRFTVRRA